MSILTAKDLSKEFGPDEIFSGVNIDIPHGARIALVGPNGAGKTTLLHLLTGLDLPSEGTVSRMRNLRIGFLPQRPELYGEHTIREEMLSAFSALRQMEAQLSELEHALTDPEQHDRVIGQYGELQEAFERAGGYTYETRIKTVLQGLGFKPEDSDKKLALLSGGQKTRVLLGRLLLEQPDLLALDEPTNHLDISAIEWLEGYLNEFPGAVLVVSHDRYFMDAIAKTVWELDFGTLDTYRGTYTQYVEQREERHARLLKEYEAQQEFIAKEEEYIRRNIAGQNVAQAKGRRTRLERLKRDGLTLKPRSRHNMHLRLGEIARSGDKVLMTENLEVGYEKPLFRAPDITLRRGECAALIGPNGAGKSTFVKTAIGLIPPLQGDVRLGAQVRIGYFAQAHEALDPNRTLLDELLRTKEMPISQARNYLASYLFTGDDVFRPVSTLSGGERGRLALAKLSLEGANLLLLDEPTNHLDIASQEILQNVLAEFDGTILLVSHDRYLIDALATQIWAVSPGKLEVFQGTYKEYLSNRDKQRLLETERAQQRATKANGKPTEKKGGLSDFQRQKRVAALEVMIESLEARLDDLNGAIAAASAGGDAGKVAALGKEYMQAEAELHATMTEWEQLVD